jgi:lipopolysaccharide/colanic/teichoic acid biosynthesis glycosyltransferase
VNVNSRRIVDVAVGVGALLGLSPIFATLSMAVLIDSGRPILYGGIRVGRDGRHFRMWKFRTMVTGADKSGSVSGPNDSRVTRVGKFLRKTKLDEIPQFVNLAKGDLTLVGPRPEVPEMIARYTDVQRKVLHFTPGITAPGEIFFTTVQEPSIPAGVDPEQYFADVLLDPKIAIDVEYFSNQTWRTDIGILRETVALMAGRTQPKY